MRSASIVAGSELSQERNRGTDKGCWIRVIAARSQPWEAMPVSSQIWEWLNFEGAGWSSRIHRTCCPRATCCGRVHLAQPMH